MINGQLIRLIERKKLSEKLSNRDLAEKLKTTEFTIGNILRARINYTDPDLFQRILDWLQVKFQYVDTKSESSLGETFHIPAGALITVKISDKASVVCNPKALLVTGAPGVIKQRSKDGFIYGKIHIMDNCFLVVPDRGDHITINRSDVEFVAPAVEFRQEYNPPEDTQ